MSRVNNDGSPANVTVYFNLVGAQIYTVNWDDAKPTDGFRLFSRRFVLVIPPWWSLPLLTAPPLLAWWAWRRSARRRFRREGRCVGCGYDLRASPAHCPECGLVPDNAPAA